MPDYSKGVIYKLCCKDPNIKDIYIGSTCNFTKRKWEHKHICNNKNNKSYYTYKYQFIRDNGGWENWDMSMVKEFSCENKRQLNAEERKQFEELGATLNKNVPNRQQTEYRKDNKQKINEKGRKYYTEKKEEIKEYNKAWVKNNSEKIKKYKENKIKICCKLCRIELYKNQFNEHKRKSKSHNFLLKQSLK